LQVFLQRFVVFILGIVFDYGDNGSWTDKPSQVVDVTVRVVASDATAEPEDFARPQILGKDLFVILASATRIPLLHLPEQALFGRQEASQAVNVDSAALANEIPHKYCWPAQLPGHLERNFVVAFPVGILGPTIKVPSKNA